jgi:hypothetical protein
MQRVDNVEPNWSIANTLIAEEHLQAPIIEVVDPHLSMFLIDRDEPRLTKSRIDIDEASLHVPYIDNDDPMRTKLLSEMLLPAVM